MGFCNKTHLFLPPIFKKYLTYSVILTKFNQTIKQQHLQSDLKDAGQKTKFSPIQVN